MISFGVLRFTFLKITKNDSNQEKLLVRPSHVKLHKGSFTALCRTIVTVDTAHTIYPRKTTFSTATDIDQPGCVNKI